MSIENRIRSKGVRPTSNRILVLRTIMQQSHPVSLGDLEELLDTLERSSIFRVLTLFADRGIVHALDDGSGALKYEACNATDHTHGDDMHVHFHCRKCKRTICFEDTPVPHVKLPAGFEGEYVNYMVKGICPDCAKRS